MVMSGEHLRPGEKLRYVRVPNAVRASSPATRVPSRSSLPTGVEAGETYAADVANWWRE